MHEVLFKRKLLTTSIEFFQDCKGGVIWVKMNNSKHIYPISPEELIRISEAYINKEA